MFKTTAHHISFITIYNDGSKLLFSRGMSNHQFSNSFVRITTEQISNSALLALCDGNSNCGSQSDSNMESFLTYFIQATHKQSACGINIVWFLQCHGRSWIFLSCKWTIDIRFKYRFKKARSTMASLFKILRVNNKWPISCVWAMDLHIMEQTCTFMLYF